jgi:hypothetical protein
VCNTYGKLVILKLVGAQQSKTVLVFGADPDRIGLLGKPPAAEHSFPSKKASSRTCLLRSSHANAGMNQYECGPTQPLFRVGHDRGINKWSKSKGLRQY